MNNNVIKNLWGNTTFYCGHNHKNPVEMDYKMGQNMFYSCPHYYVDNQNRPGERSCANRLSFTDAETIIGKISDLMIEQEELGGMANVKGYKFTYKGIDVKVVDYDPTLGTLKVEILNKKALK